MNQILIENKDACRFVIHDRLNGVKNMLHDLIEIKRVADFLLYFDEQVIFCFIGKVHHFSSYHFLHHNILRKLPLRLEGQRSWH